MLDRIVSLRRNCSEFLYEVFILHWVSFSIRFFFFHMSFLPLFVRDIGQVVELSKILCDVRREKKLNI